jgi:hypothetical protein
MKTIIKNLLTGKELQIAENNFPKRMNWKEAMCSGREKLDKLNINNKFLNFPYETRTKKIHQCL